MQQMHLQTYGIDARASIGIRLFFASHVVYDPLDLNAAKGG